MELNYHGITVNVDTTGVFAAKVNDTFLRKPSMDAMKKAIDALLNEREIAIPALKGHAHTALTPVVIVGYDRKAERMILKGTGVMHRWSGGDLFARDEAIEAEIVYLDTQIDEVNAQLHRLRETRQKTVAKLHQITPAEVIAAKIAAPETNK